MSGPKPWEEKWEEDRRKLAAGAVGLMQALLAVEYVYNGGTDACAWCGSDEGSPHSVDCQRQAALREAGVIE